MFQFAFLLGIVFISFNIIWFLFTTALKAILGEIGDAEKYILRVTQSYFLASVTAIATIKYAESGYSINALIFMGVIVLFLYLINKIEQRKRAMNFNFQMNKEFVSFNQNNLKYDLIIAISSVVLFVVSVLNPTIAQIGINNWLFDSIHGLYNSFFIGSIIKVVGVFFIISIFFKGIISFRLLYTQFSEMINGKKSPAFDETDGFTDFEIIEDDDLGENGPIQIEDK
ncbi:MAG: hypothetical protein ABF294_08505 [Flavobacteriales bacterium]